MYGIVWSTITIVERASVVAALHGLTLMLCEIMEIHPHAESLYSHKLITHWRLFCIHSKALLQTMS